MRDFTESITDATFSLLAPALVEASAGTGKTYNIQNVYLRLVLQHALPVEKVLVVTFTEAATFELRGRLRAILALTRAVLEGGENLDTEDQQRIQALLAASGIGWADGQQRIDALNRIKLAIMDFDNAAIFTIHGFCNRALQRYAFECGHDPLAELVAHESEILTRVCRDWWRQHTYTNEPCMATVPFDSLQRMENMLGEYLHKPSAILHPPPCDGELLRKDLTEKAALVREAMGADADLFRGSLPDITTAAETVDWESLTLSFGVPDWLQDLQGVISNFAVPALQGKFVWQGGVIAGPGGQMYDPGAICDVARAHAAAMVDWSRRIRSYLPDAKPVGAFLEAIAGLPTLQDADAKTFLRWVGTLAKTDLSRMLKDCILAKVVPAVGRMVEDAEAYRQVRQADCLRELAALVQAEVRNRSVMTYNDMLRNVMLALCDPEKGAHLQDVLRAEFRAAMIDEFQDTDPVQYSIFRTLFMGTGIPLVFVGDPKQAIYGFRGGDVYTYYNARAEIATQDAGRLFHLGTNYRSEPGLVAAINAFFEDRAGDVTFGHEAIPYSGDLQAHDMDAQKRLLLPEGNDTPLQIWRYTAMGARGGKPGQASEPVQAMYRDLAREVARLLGDAQCRIGNQRIHAGDVAVLAHTNQEGGEIWKALREHGVHAVRQNTGNIFDSQEARGLGLILKAMLTPSDAYAVRGALVSHLLPCSVEQLLVFCRAEATGAQEEASAAEASGAASQSAAWSYPLDPEDLPASLEGWMALFREAGGRWREGSFMVAFQLLMRKTHLRAHVVQQPDGERTLTNLLHLVELVHKSATALRNRPAGLVQWFQQQLNAVGREENDEYLMRMASDEDAVKIMTIHKSKGLQFPIVFVPTLWRKSAGGNARHGLLAYHDEENQLILTLASQDAGANAAAQAEQFQEDTRLLYVALTRAINRVYLVQWGEPAPSACALDRLFVRIGAACPATIAIRENDAFDRIPPYDVTPPDETAVRLSPPARVSVNHKHGHTSFSALEANTQELVADVRDLDEGKEPSVVIPERPDIFSIPGGKQTGNCWHDIFEAIDFQSDDGEIGGIIDQQIATYRICQGGTEAMRQARVVAVHEMVRTTLRVPLRMEGRGKPFCLRDVARSARRSELAFRFALRQNEPAVSTAAIRTVLRKHWAGDPTKAAFCDALQASWDKCLPLGYLTGFIDLVFCQDGRFYLVDWKSNRRTGALADYGRDGLENEMARNFYFLQYLLYLVALDGYLAARLRGYCYEEHIGGVFYVFLRGVAHHDTHGVFADRPAEALIRDLRALLTGGAA